jgi:hypothetical protein
MRDGRLFWHCHADCEQARVQRALAKRGLLPPPGEPDARNGHKRGVESDPLGLIVAEYLYPPRHRVTRHNPKTFRPWHRGSDGTWLMGEGDEKLPLYHQDDLLTADPEEWVFVPEGEKDVDNLRACGLVATCNPGGAEKWRDEFSEQLRGRRVAILVDNDRAGERHAAQVARSLSEIAREVRVVQLPDLPAKGDVSDWLDAGGTADALLRLVDVTPEWKPAEHPTTARLSELSERRLGERLVVRSLSSVQATTIDWLWPRWLARGKFHLLGGHAGDGKGTLTAQLAAIGSVGGCWPDGTRAPRFRSLFLLGEDALDDTLRPRLDVHGADPTHVLAIETVLDDVGHERFFNVERHLDLLEAEISEHRIDLVVIDPLTTIMAGRDRNAEGDTRDSLTPLLKLADRSNVAIFGIAHVGKPSGTIRTPAQRILGATAFHALARVVWMTAPADDGTMALGVVKSNLAMKPDPLLWSRAEDGPIVWHGVAARGIGELLANTAPASPRANAEGFLREVLAGGSKAATEIEQTAKDRGITVATLRRAAEVIGIVKFKEATVNGRWFWRLPDGEPRVAELKMLTSDEGEQLRPSVAEPKMLTPRDPHVSIFASSKALTGAGSEQLHATTRDLASSSPNGCDNGMEAGEGAHTRISSSEHLRSDPAEEWVEEVI